MAQTASQALMLQTSWHVHDQYVYAAMAVLGTLLVVVVSQWLIQYSRWAAWARSLQGVAPPFINIVGVLFGLTLAFLANDTWSAHDRALKSVYREADSLHSLVVLSDTLPDGLRNRLRTALARYAADSIDEWQLLGERTESRQVLADADALLILLASPEIQKAAGDNVQAMMLRKAGDVRDERDQRVALSQTHVNPLKWCGMAFLGMLTLLSIAVVHVDRPRAAFVAVVLFALAAAPTAAIVLIQGNPFQHPTDVTPAPIRAAVAGLNAG